MNTYNILHYGAIPDGTTNCAPAIQRAVDDATRAGGGRVIVPAGRFLSGTVLLKSHVELHLELGAVLLSSLDENQIDPFPAANEDDNKDTGWDGGFFLGARDAENVAITGLGVIDGQGGQVFFDLDDDNGFHECPKTCAPFRPRMMLFENVTNFTVKDVTLKDAAFWTLHMAGCKHVRITGVMILGDDRGANNDGIDPDCCQDVVISDCIIHTGDDAIVLKTTKPMAKRYGPCENITITNCVLHSRDSALKIGTETHGIIRNVILSDCVVKDCSRGVGVWVRDGGTVENIHIHHLTGATRRYADRYAHPGAPGWWGKGEPIFISATHRKGKEDQSPGVIRNVTVDHVTLACESCIFLGGEDVSPIRNVRFSDIDLTFRHQGTQPGGLFDEQPSARHIYPHRIPALYARSVDGLRLRSSHAAFEYVQGQDMPWDGALTELERCTRAHIEWEED